MAGRPILRRTCAQPVSFRAMPENEIPRALHVDIYLFFKIGRCFLRFSVGDTTDYEKSVPVHIIHSESPFGALFCCHRISRLKIIANLYRRYWQVAFDITE